MEKHAYFSRGFLQRSRVHFAICPGGHIRLRAGHLSNGSLVVDGQWTGKKARVDIRRVEGNTLVKVGNDYEPFKKSAILDVVTDKLLAMPNNVAVFATELAWRAIMARRETGAL